MKRANGWASVAGIGLASAVTATSCHRPERAATPPPAQPAPAHAAISEQPVEPAAIASDSITEAGPEPVVAQPDAGAEPAPAEVPQPTPAPLAAGRDPRRLSSQARPQQFLVAEIRALEQLFANTLMTSPDRPVLLRRLAESYVELEYSAQREKDPSARKLVSAARKKAIEHYRRLWTDHPTFPKLDEVLYYLGYEYEKGREPARARAVYRELVKDFPTSPYLDKIPAALRPR